MVFPPANHFLQPVIISSVSPPPSFLFHGEITTKTNTSGVPAAEECAGAVVEWTVPKEIQPVHPKGNQSWILNSNTLATWCEELTHLKRPWCWERLKAGGEWDDRGWGGWMASPIRWTWVWVSSGICWWTGKPGVLKSMRLQSWTWLSSWNELNWTESLYSLLLQWIAPQILLAYHSRSMLPIGRMFFHVVFQGSHFYYLVVLTTVPRSPQQLKKRTLWNTLLLFIFHWEN